MVRDEIVLQIGQLILRVANETSSDWSYAGYVYRSTDGRNASRQNFLFGPNLGRDFLEDRAFKTEVRTIFPRLWQVATDDDENNPVAIKVGVRAVDRELKVLFEFENPDRWAVGPGNVTEATQIYLGDLFPEALQ
ncbi:hypothetical protein [Nereida sp. MMG025]|uniref:hypothetical protein n=1 Tax=Nereida sp. MMG025 TaxID=2909981 RepID=UPI001F2D50AF|nr:hypothetical protein [Nereida sp. MMG025]MCF6446177.1 hypothetical protein [Nereida sp. MMG025]